MHQLPNTSPQTKGPLTHQDELTPEQLANPCCWPLPLASRCATTTLWNPMMLRFLKGLPGTDLNFLCTYYFLLLPSAPPASLELGRTAIAPAAPSCEYFLHQWSWSP